jgi:dTDP-glucose 4,6-dehydratase|tara:strand:+ start:3570 stop:4556 length:987 start_codon:yes stop_codon:yes gene_type:complete
MKIMVTGGCGFIGHHFVDHIIKTTNHEVVVIDKLSYASMGLDRLRDPGLLFHPRLKVFAADFAKPFPEGLRREIGEDVNVIVHMGAESHVDNSIKDPVSCFENNVGGTVEMLEYARSLPDLKLFFYFSTDEVFGPAPGETAYKEWDRHKPTNPYSASKSAAENICIAYENTYGIPIMIVNVMNAFGERQHVEKFIPNTIRKVVNGDKVLIHSYPDKKRPGSRFYIHARNISSAVVFLMETGEVGEKYNIVGDREVDNLELAQMIAKYVGKPLKYEMVDFHRLRPGHDLRYGLCGDKMRDMGWEIPVEFEKSLKKTIEWTLRNQKWLEK